MAWAAVAGAAVGGLMSSAGGGGGGGASQTASKEPWAEAAPWLKSLLSQGQDLSSHYTSNPFNPAQIAAYGNMADQGAYMRSLVPSLLGQASSQPLSFDPMNPTARPQAYQFNGGGGLLGAQAPNTGLLAGGGMNPVSTMPAIAPRPVVAPTISGPDAELQGRYQQYKTGSGPHLDYDTWKVMYGNAYEHGNAGPGNGS